jgi:ribonuclease P protein component
VKDQSIRYRFGKYEKLCSQKQIDFLFRQGKWEHGKTMKAVYCLLDTNTPSLPAILISVPKRSFKKAVLRNRIRRRIREAYRLNKQLIAETVVKSGKQLIAAFIFSLQNEEDYHVIEEDMKKLLQRIALRVSKRKSG